MLVVVCFLQVHKARRAEVEAVRIATIYGQERRYITLTPCCGTFHDNNLAWYNLEQARPEVPRSLCTPVCREIDDSPAPLKPQWVHVKMTVLCLSSSDTKNEEGAVLMSR